MSTTWSASSGMPYLNPNETIEIRSASSAPLGDDGPDLAREVVHVELGGVDEGVGPLAQVGEDRALLGDAVEDAALALQRVRAADLLEPADQHLVGRVEEQDPVLDARLAQALRAPARGPGRTRVRGRRSRRRAAARAHRPARWSACRPGA